MSVLLVVRMDIDANDSNFWEITNASFPIKGAYVMKELPTLQWKIFAADPKKHQASGIYLFHSREAAENRAKEAILQLQQRPSVFNVTSQIWEIIEESTRICEGPIDVPMIADLPQI